MCRVFKIPDAIYLVVQKGIATTVKITTIIRILCILWLIMNYVFLASSSYNEQKYFFVMRLKKSISNSRLSQ